MRERGERDLGDDRDRRGVQQLGDLRPDERGADEDLAVDIDDEPCRSRLAAAGEARAGGPGCRQIERGGGDACLQCAIECQPGGGDLRVGEDHPRRAGPVADRRAVLAEDVIGGDPRLVLAGVRQQRAAVDVTDRVQP